MFRTHHDELGKSEAARLVLGLIDNESQILHAETIVHGDTAHSYVQLQTTANDVEHIAHIRKMKAGEFDAHTDGDRGWPVPEWWPSTSCKAGVTYQVDAFDAAAPDDSSSVINWCPAQNTAYIQHFDY